MLALCAGSHAPALWYGYHTPYPCFTTPYSLALFSHPLQDLERIPNPPQYLSSKDIWIQPNPWRLLILIRFYCMLACDPDHVYVRPTTSDNHCIPACALDAEELDPWAYSPQGSNMRPSPFPVRERMVRAASWAWSARIKSKYDILLSYLQLEISWIYG